MNSEKVQEYEGGRMRRPRAKSVLKPKKPTKVNKQALLRKKLMKHFGGFFNEMQEDPPMSPPDMSPQDGGSRRRSKSPVRRAKSPVKKAPVRRRPRRLGGEGNLIQDMANIFESNIIKPSGAGMVFHAAAAAPQQSLDFGQQSLDFGANTVGQVGKLVSGGRKRRSSSPKRRVARATVVPKRRAASPKRRVARPAMRRMFN